MSDAITPINSIRLAALRFPLITLVIYIHARSGTITFGDATVSFNSSIVDGVKRTISDGIARTAVPLFFLLSGYLIFYGQKTWSWTGFGAKIRRRVDTLLVPYVFWNLALFIILAIVQSTSLRVFFNSSGILRNMTWQQQAVWVLGLQRYPINYQFWFIRDLMILVLSGPLWFLLARQIWVAVMAIAGLAIFWVFDVWPIEVPAIEAVLFFFVGTAAGIHAKDIFNGPPLAATVIAYFALLIAFILTQGTAAESFVQHALVGLGILVALGVVRKLPRRFLEPVALLAPVSFFVFAVHEPLTTTLLKISYRVLPVSNAMALSVYLLVPIIVIVLALFLHRIALTIAPGLTRRVTGR